MNPCPSKVMEPKWLSVLNNSGRNTMRPKNHGGGSWKIAAGNRQDLNNWWNKVSDATKNGLLGYSAYASSEGLHKVFQRGYKDKMPWVIMVATFDAGDVADKQRVWRELIDIGIPEEAIKNTKPRSKVVGTAAITLSVGVDDVPAGFVMT